MQIEKMQDTCRCI